MTTLQPNGTPLSVRATGLLAEFQAAGVLAVPDVQVATALLRLGAAGSDPATGDDELMALAAALCVRGLRHGSVALDLADSRHVVVTDEDDVVDTHALPWPDPDEWVAACRRHPIVADGPQAPADRPLRWDTGLLSLQKYWQYEQAIAHQVRDRSRSHPPPVDQTAAASLLDRLFPDPRADAQRLAAAVAATSRFMILSGGPGTGKTTAIARILVLLHTIHGPGLRTALAAPTGKAAARLTEATDAELRTLFAADPAGALQVPPATTVHRLLGTVPGVSNRFRHDRRNPLPHDVVVVDECSMVSITMMARLLDAVRPKARLILVGDPDQLASVEAGAILADLVHVRTPGDPATKAQRAALAPAAAAQLVPATGTVTLQHNFRSEEGIAQVALTIRHGDPDAVVDALRSLPDSQVAFLETAPGEHPEHVRNLAALRDDVVRVGSAVIDAAAAGQAAKALDRLHEHRLLCAHRNGPFGVARWNALVRSWLVEAHGLPPEADRWSIGQALIVTANDPELRLSNGDCGVIVATADGPMAAFARGNEVALVPPVRLDHVLSLEAMTIHRGQGSQFRAVTVILPPPDSPLLTRELLYTAVTRARERVRVVGSVASVRAAVTRRVTRASGLRHALEREFAAPGPPHS